MVFPYPFPKHEEVKDDRTGSDRFLEFVFRDEPRKPADGIERRHPKDYTRIVDSLMRHVNAVHAEDWFETEEIYKAATTKIREKAA